MDKDIILESLKKLILSDELEESKKEEAIELIEIIETKSLYDAVLYDALSLIHLLDIRISTAYEIPEFRQVFIDSIKNPKLKSQKNSFIDIVYIFTNRISKEIFLKDQEIMQLIPNLTYEQAKRFFGGEETAKLLEEKEIYNIMISKAEKDETFYGTLDYSEYSIEDGHCVDITRASKNGFKLVNEPLDRKLRILRQLPKDINIYNLIIDFKNQPTEVQDFIIENSVFAEQVIKEQAKTQYGEAIIPEPKEFEFINKHLNILIEMPFEQKINFIIKMNNAESQKYLIIKLNIMKNILSYSEYSTLFSRIKDKDFLIESLCRKDVLEPMHDSDLRTIITRLPKEYKTKLFENKIFEEHFYGLRRYESINVLAAFGEEIIDELLPKIKNIRIDEMFRLFKVTESHKYLEKVLEIVKEKEKSGKEKDKEEIEHFLYHNALNYETIGKLTEEEFSFFISRYNPVEFLEDALSYLDRGSLDTVVSEKDQKILDTIEPNMPLTKEQINALGNYRLTIKSQIELRESIRVLKNTKGRSIRRINYAIFDMVSQAERDMLLEHMSYKCLIDNVSACRHVLDYVYELSLDNPETFGNIIDEEPKLVYHHGDNLPAESIPKLKKLFMQSNDIVQESMINETILKDPETLSYIKDKVKQDPNRYNTKTYSKKIFKFLTNEEIKFVLENLSLKRICEFYSDYYYMGEETDEIIASVLASREDEIIYELNKVTYDVFASVRPSTIINNMLKDNKDKEKLLRKLNIAVLIKIYEGATFSINQDEDKNEIIVKIISEQPQVLLTVSDKDAQNILSSLSKTSLQTIISNLTTTDILMLFAKTKNKELETKIMVEFDKEPYFINDSSLTAEDILSKLEEDNKEKILSKIDEQFNELELPFNIKSKLRKSSYDEKLFLIYGVKKDIFDIEKYILINELLSKDPFALNTLNINLFEPSIFAISKTIIPKIYRYENLTVSYIGLLKANNNRSKILLLLIEYLNKTTTISEVYIKKLETIVSNLSNKADPNIDRINIKEITEEELAYLEEYLLQKNIKTLISSEINFISSYNDSIDHLGTTFKKIEQKRISEIDKEMKKAKNIEEMKNCIFKKYFKLELSDIENILLRYSTTQEKVLPHIKNQEYVKLFNTMTEIYNCEEIEKLQTYYYSKPTPHTISEYLYMYEAFDKAYNDIIASEMLGYKNGEQATLSMEIDGEKRNIEVMNLDKDFELIVHSTDAYGSMEMINEDYFDSWNYSERTTNHGICTSFISNSNLGTAKVAGKGVMFCFTKLNSKSITSMAPYDLMSHNDGISTTSNRPPMFTDTKDLASCTRHTHNELVLERRNITDDSEYPVIQPDCLIMFEEMSESIKANTLKAQQDFAKKGIELPIIYISRKKTIEQEAKRLNEMLNIYTTNFDLELLREIINKYESNRCGMDFDSDFDPTTLFQKDRIYELIITTIKQIKENQDIEAANTLTAIIEEENYKFAIIKETVGDRAHSFDLLDQKLKLELESLKEICKTENIEINTNFVV